MNDFVRQLMETATSVIVPKTFDLLSQVLTGTISTFDGTEVEFQPNTNVFYFENNGVYYETAFNLNTGMITVTAAIGGRDNIIARCAVGIDGSYTESYSRMNAETKQRITGWFGKISEINIQTLGTSPENTTTSVEAETVEAEIVEEPSAE